MYSVCRNVHERMTMADARKPSVVRPPQHKQQPQQRSIVCVDVQINRVGVSEKRSGALVSVVKASGRSVHVLSMTDNSGVGQVTQVGSSSSAQSHLDEWLADVTQRQHAKLTCDCTFCLPPPPPDTSSTAAPAAAFRSTKMTATSGGSKPVFTCASCARSFASEKYLNMHAALHRGTAGSSKYLDIHAALHVGTAGSSKYLCIHAALHRVTAGSSKYLNIHAALHRGTAGSSKYLDIHAALHRGTARSSRAVHAPALHGAVSGAKDKWTCEVCGKVFAHTSNYKNHIRTHSDDRPFVCHICSIGFKERYHLKKHALFKHSGELNEACRRCGKRFKDSTAVRAHERIHSDARPYSCQRCGKAFKTSECLWHHDHRSKTCGRPRRAVDRPPVMSATAVHSSSESLSRLLDASVDVKSFLPTAARVATTHDVSQTVKTEHSTAVGGVFTLSDVKADHGDIAMSVGVPAWLSHGSNERRCAGVAVARQQAGGGRDRAARDWVWRRQAALNLLALRQTVRVVAGVRPTLGRAQRHATIPLPHLRRRLQAQSPPEEA